MKQLKVIATVNHILQSTINNIGFAFHVSWPWMLALLPFNVGINLYVANEVLLGAMEPDPATILLSLLLVVLSTVAFASIAVSWHRYILLDEIPQGWARLRLDGIVFRYIGISLLITLMFVVGGGLIGGVLGFVIALVAQSFGNSAMYVLLAIGLFVLFVWALPTAFRLMITLPATAVGRRDYSFSNAWKDSRGNFWQLLGVILLIVICFALVGLVAGLAGYFLNKLGFAGISVSLAVQLAINWVSTIAGITMLTSLYGIFHEGRAV